MAAASTELRASSVQMCGCLCAARVLRVLRVRVCVVCVCVSVCVHACVRVCVRVRVCVCWGGGRCLWVHASLHARSNWRVCVRARVGVRACVHAPA